MGPRHPCPPLLPEDLGIRSNQEASERNFSQGAFRKLKKLEDNGLIRREVQGTRPLRVLYRLTDVGLMSAKLGKPVILYLKYRRGSTRAISHNESEGQISFLPGENALSAIAVAAQLSHSFAIVF